MRYHVAILKKSWGMLPKILTGEKTIESRWYQKKILPWGKIAIGDIVYFKNSGEPVTVKAKVARVLSFEDFDAKAIIKKFGKKICLQKAPENKKYCLLIFLKDVKKLKPFNINKSGISPMSAWLTVNNLSGFRGGGGRDKIDFLQTDPCRE